MKAEIITIGDEILIGQIVDTNSAYISQELNKIGVSVHQITSVQDDKQHILTALEEASKRAKIVLVTGGLGPTKDDITKNTFCEYFEDELIEDQDVLEHIKSIFKKFDDAPISSLNRQQALIPSRAKVMNNIHGTACGMWMEKDEVVFVAMPGVPYEMKAILSNEVLPRLREKFDFPFILHRTLTVYGIGESALAERIEDWENQLPKHIKLAYLPNYGRVRLRLSGVGNDEQKLKESIDSQVEELKPLLEDLVVSLTEEEPIEVQISKILTKRGFFLSSAESFTGGAIATQFTMRPGASTCFKGSLVCYSTEIKKKVLNVPADLIEKYSVVSAEVAESMAKNAQKLLKTDYAIATTGNAGPTKGESDAEVGTAFIAIATPEKVFSEKFMFGKSREKVVQKSITKAFELLLVELKQLPEKNDKEENS
ncbi:MAG TPA: competence/damage-inducible protein A [Salinimicrobium sp.]|nr:competence/damage-inducible protein A [Salinimicrobium sp.]